MFQQLNSIITAKMIILHIVIVVIIAIVAMIKILIIIDKIYLRFYLPQWFEC